MCMKSKECFDLSLFERNHRFMAAIEYDPTLRLLYYQVNVGVLE